MVVYKNILFAIGLIMVSIEILIGQTIPYKLYTPHDGLAQSQVMSVFQDSRGYIWTGTKDGFSSFNGMKFNTFRANSGLPYVYIEQIGEDSNGNLRFFTGKWWCKYDGNKISYDTSSIRPDHGRFCIDSEHTIWAINTRDYELYYSKDWKLWKNASQKIKALKGKHWNWFHFDTHFNRLILHERENRQTYSLSGRDLKKIFHKELGIAIEKPNTRRKLFGFSNDSLLRIEKDTVRFVKKIPKFSLRSCIVKTDETVHFLANSKRTFYTLKKEGSVDSLPLRETIDYLFLDRNENVWASSEQGLIRFFVNGFRMFDRNKLYSIWSMIEDNRGSMYFGRYFGNFHKETLTRLNNEKLETLVINPIKNTYFNPEFGAFHFGGCRDLNGNLYFPMAWGIMKYDGKKFSYFGKPTKETAISMYVLYDKKKNVLISGTNAGIHIVDLDTESTKYYGANKGLNRAGMVVGMAKDAQGNYWLGTITSIARFNTDQDTIDKNYTRNLKNLSYYGTSAIYCDFKGTIWSSSHNGLLRYNERGDTFALVAPSIIRTTVSSISGYKDKYLIVGASDGIYFIDLQAFYASKSKLIVRCFNQYNGYLGIEPNQNTIYVDSKNDVWVAASDIVVKINPSELNMHPEFLSPYITAINNEKITYEQYHQVIKLPHGTNTAKISFEAVGFERPFNTEFSYKLNNGRWSNWLTEDFASFDNLSSGTHSFFIRTRPAGTVDERDIKETSIGFKISIPFYREPYFPVLVGLGVGILSLVLLFFGWRILVLRKREEEAKKQHYAFVERQEELERERTRYMKYLQIQTLQAQLNPHFIFNVLQAIQTRIYEGSREVASSLIVDLGNLIRRFLDSSVNMDLSRIRNSEITLKQEINLLRSYIEFEQLQYSNRFEYEILVDQGLETENVQVPPMLIQPYVENAIKHGILYEKDKRCRLEIVFKKTMDEVLVCSIIDNGVGRKRAKEIQESFIRMYKSRGTQILEERITIMQELGHGISVEVRDNPKGGTIVELRIDM